MTSPYRQHLNDISKPSQHLNDISIKTYKHGPKPNKERNDKDKRTCQSPPSTLVLDVIINLWDSSFRIFKAGPLHPTSLNSQFSFFLNNSFLRLTILVVHFSFLFPHVLYCPFSSVPWNIINPPSPPPVICGSHFS